VIAPFGVLSYEWTTHPFSFDILPFSFDFFFKAMPIVALVAIPIAWFKRTSVVTGSDSVFGTWLLIVLLLGPSVFSGMWVYNTRADTSLPEGMKVVSKGIDEEGCHLVVETIDGSSSYTIQVSRSFYDEHEIGGPCELTLRKGALGYKWLDGYK
jgi:hypothetical protein